MNQLTAELLAQNQQLAYAVVPEEDGPDEGEEVLLWEKRKKKTHKELQKKVG
jgi:hypothetical protein